MPDAQTAAPQAQHGVGFLQAVDLALQEAHGVHVCAGRGGGRGSGGRVRRVVRSRLPAAGGRRQAPGGPQQAAGHQRTLALGPRHLCPAPVTHSSNEQPTAQHTATSSMCSRWPWRPCISVASDSHSASSSGVPSWGRNSCRGGSSRRMVTARGGGEGRQVGLHGSGGIRPGGRIPLGCPGSQPPTQRQTAGRWGATAARPSSSPGSPGPTGPPSCRHDSCNLQLD